MAAGKEKKIKEALRSLVESLHEGMAQNLIALVLFGSRARGETLKASDWDIFVLARSLPVSPMKRYTRLRTLCKEELDGGVSFLAKTQREFEEGFPSFYLDLALDGVILFDTDGYMEARLSRVREIIKEAGLKRNKISGGFFWDWKKYPASPEWEISWAGFEPSSSQAR
ncbi:MAG: nucleotidyltransferase domain-containing protein [Candidatus Methylomirabilia bacterium]